MQPTIVIAVTKVQVRTAYKNTGMVGLNSIWGLDVYL
jgi:hypothetical protein